MKVCRLALLAYFLIFTGLFAFLTLPFESPDELNHLMYINPIARAGRLPNQYQRERFVWGEGHQPPLYYDLRSRTHGRGSE